MPTDPRRRLTVLHRQLRACNACPSMHGPAVHGPALITDVLLVGQAPGPHEGAIGRPFAWTAGKTLFRWFEAATGVNEARFRDRVYMTAVARCFPGKAAGGGDRRPDRDEISRCQRFLSREVDILRPRLILPVGGLAIEQVLGHKGPLSEVVGVQRRARYHGVEADVICLPHPQRRVDVAPRRTRDLPAGRGPRARRGSPRVCRDREQPAAGRLRRARFAAERR